MVRITEDLVRKRAEHNESEICTLEELALHQEDIDKIEHLQNWCRNLEILLLQNNIISRIENVHKLKCLKYLNLALNNIEKIENLELCESLEKLDLTLNFIGDLESVCNLQNNYNLTNLFLVGNPCTDYKGYRNYVLAKLPQLKHLDGSDVTKTELLKAKREVKTLENQIKKQQMLYYRKREEQRARYSKRNPDGISDEDFWKEKTENCPEIRVEMVERSRKQKGKDQEKEIKEQKPVKMFTNDGRPLNMNQPKLKFTFGMDDPEKFVLDLAIYKYLDTNLIDVDIQPTYVTVKVKGKVFQVALSEEICVDKSTAQRSQITGHLVITMPKLSFKPKNSDSVPKIGIENISASDRRQRREFLEIGGGDRLNQLCNLSDNANKKTEFIDDPEVPPLE